MAIKTKAEIADYMLKLRAGELIKEELNDVLVDILETVTDYEARAGIAVVEMETLQKKLETVQEQNNAYFRRFAAETEKIEEKEEEKKEEFKFDYDKLFEGEK